MTDPSSLVQNHIARLFPPEEQDEVTRLLKEDCGTVLPLTDNASPEFFERVQCAALKLSEGRMDKLYDAIALAQTDWRDLLVVAGFAEDPVAHKDWRE
jgi:hypothetical protein